MKKFRNKRRAHKMVERWCQSEALFSEENLTKDGSLLFQATIPVYSNIFFGREPTEKVRNIVLEKMLEVHNHWLVHTQKLDLKCGIYLIINQSEFVQSRVIVSDLNKFPGPKNPKITQKKFPSHNYPSCLNSLNFREELVYCLDENGKETEELLYKTWISSTEN